MTVTIHGGWWLAPLLVTVLAFAWAFWADKDNKPGAYGAGAFLSLLIFGAALIASLVAWLVWAVLS